MPSGGSQKRLKISTDPSKKDEPSVSAELFGRNVSHYVELQGWTHSFPLSFPDIRPTSSSLYIKSYNPEKSDSFIRERIKRELEIVRPLSQCVQHMPTGNYGEKLKAPLNVVVVGKKQLKVVTHEDRILIFGELLIADFSGVAMLKQINTAIEFLYKQVNLGDRLLITSGTLVSLKDFYSTSLTITNSLPVVIKITEFQCPSVFKLNEIQSARHHFCDLKLWTPSSFLQMREKMDATSSECQVGDIIGVISHVSRLERYRRYESKMRLEKDKIEEVFPQFDVFSWIEIVDNSSISPLSFLLYLNSTNWSAQNKLIPGSVILITNVENCSKEYEHGHLRSSSLSQQFVNEEIRKYLDLMGNATEVVAEVNNMLDVSTASEIFSRSDLNWTVGGSYDNPLNSDFDSTLLESYHDRTAEREGAGKPWPKISKLPLYRREIQYLIFRGYILRYKLVDSEEKLDTQGWSWKNSDVFNSLHPEARTICKMYDPYPTNVNAKPIWSMFRRRLLEIDFTEMSPADTDTTKNGGLSFYHHAATMNKKFTTSLFMPVGSKADLRGLDVADGSSFYALDIYNAEGEPSLQRHIVTWKPSVRLTIEHMKRKLETNGKGEVLLLLKVYRSESRKLSKNHGYQLILEDFCPYIPDSTI